MASAAARAEGRPAPKKILILNSFRISIPFEVKSSKAFRSSMATYQAGPIEIYEEHLDLSSKTALDHKAALVELLKIKYSRQNLDLVIAVGNPASDFLLEHGQELFPGISQVISGNSTDAIKYPPRNRRMTSVYFEYDLRGGLEFALKLLPATREVVVVTGSDPFSKYLKKTARKQLAGLKTFVEVSYIPEMTLEEMRKLVSQLPADHLVFYIGFSMDSAGNFYKPHKACQIVSQASSVPVIGITDTYLGHGILGGSLISAEALGINLADVAQRILTGENPDDIPATKAQNLVLFDWRQLKRWDLLNHPLITGGEIRYQEHSFFDLYWHWVLAVSGLLVLQALVILLLLVQKRLKREKELERQKSERILRESEERYRQMFHEDQVMQWLINPQNGAIVDANQAACDFYGYSHEEMTAQNIFEINTADRKNTTELITEVRNRKTISFQAKHRLASGEIRDVHVYCNYLSHQGRTFLHSTVFDITKRKQAEKALQLSEDKFSKLFFSSPVSIIITTMDEGRLLEVNDAFLEQSGFSRQQCLGRTTIELGIWPDASSYRSKLLELCKRQGYLRNIETKVCFKNQIRTGLWSTDTFIYDNQECLFNVLIDITERKQTEEALLRSEAQFRTLVDKAPVAIVIQINGKNAYANHKAIETFGAKSEKDLLGRSVLDRVPDRFQEMAKERIRLLNQEKIGEPNVEYQYLRIDGTPFDVEVMSVPIHYQGEDGALVFFQDITEKKKQQAEQEKLEAQLRQSQKMEAIGTLAGGIAHDFNNILGVVIGFSEMAIVKAQGGQQHTRELKQILKAGERARDLVRQILTFSRKVEMALTPLDLNKELEHTTELLKRTLPKMISIETSLAPDLMPVLADSNQLEQIILNLATNAEHAMPDGGRLAIDTQNIILTDEYCERHMEVKPGRYVLLQVSDTGQGMDVETLEYIFDPFYTTKDVGEGTGLGLSTVFGIVKAFRGQISCYSEPGMGTTFKIYLPAHEKDIISEEDSSLTAEESTTGNETILLVDDDDLLRDLGQEMLSLVGYNMITATSGEQAIKVYAEQKDSLDLVILDLGMPGIGGYKALEGILEIDSQAKVIIASGYAANGIGKKALNDGASAYIAKPFNSNELLATVRKVLDGA
jgi:two-component system cell cycle sensor histidine kinase/response regulator CckA